jgi:UDP-N-acetylmuramoyl-L-alanyl-D-glutamate--2,6-diaminopimelate ligase
MVDAGLTHCVLETTSHSLAQHRVAAVDFDIAVITNITHEHLDYHGSYEAYHAAKASLFTRLAQGTWKIKSGNRYKEMLEKTAVLNRDDTSYERLAAISAPRQLSYGLGRSADVYATDIDYRADATHFSLWLPQEGAPPLHLSLTSPFVGAFNVYNMLAAATAAHALQVAPAVIKQGLASLKSLEGRMERIDEGQPFLTVVDFAHTPNALEKAISAARRMAAGRVITVFGSAGKRDEDKRRLMAEVSARAADLTVLTAEDPRTEALAQILQTMAAGCRSQGAVEGKTFWRIPDRGRAIYHALTLARPTDVVLICGKGHEQSMCFGTKEYPWDDREATRAALRAFLQGETVPNLGLPTYTGASE